MQGVVWSDHVTYERGIHLRGTQLWFDAEVKRPLCFLTSLVRRLPPQHHRCVASAAVANTIRCCGYKGTILPAPEGRWVGVGGCQVSFVELDRAGTNSALLLQMQGTRLLVTGPLPRDGIHRLPHADYLITSSPGFGWRGISVDRVAAKLSTFCRQSVRNGQKPVVVVDNVPAAVVLARALEENEIVLQYQGFLRFWGATSEPPMPIGCLRLPGRKQPSDGAVAWVSTGLGFGVGGPVQGDASPLFRMAFFADGRDLAQSVVSTGVSGVSVVAVPAHLRERVADSVPAGVAHHIVSPVEQLSLPGEGANGDAASGHSVAQ